MQTKALTQFIAITLIVFTLIAPHTAQAQGAAQEISYDVEYARAKHTTLTQGTLGGQGCVFKEPYVSNNPFDSNDYRIEAFPPPWQPVTGADQPKVTPGFDFWTGGGIDTLWYCPPGTLDKLRDENGNFLRELTASDSDPVTTAEQIAIMIIGRVFWVFGVIGAWFVYIAGQFLTPLLTVKSFITNPIVTTGWPFVQGLANLGFILAMLFIAATTTLRIESFNARRMLPRLLIAALLINFSLVVGGILIDASRLVMAVLVRTMTAGNIGDLAKSILDSSALIQGAYDTSNLGLVELNTGAQNWGWLKGVALSTIMIWAVGISFMVITIGLIIRYVMLILLLIVSPIAYLTFALPKAEGIARAWWNNFLKYVIYGPVALFTLTLIVVVGEMYADGKNALGGVANGGIFDTMIQIIIVCALSVGAALAGKKLGTMGAASTVGFVKNKTQQAGRVGANAVYKGSGAKDFVDNYKDERKKAAKKRSSNSSLGRLGKRTAKGVSTVQDTVGDTAKAAALGGLAGGPAGAGIGAATAVLGKAAASSRRNQKRNAAFDSTREFINNDRGRDQLQNSDQLTPATLGNAKNIGDMNRNTVSDVISRGSDKQRTAIAGSVASMDAPDNPDEFFESTINSSVNVINEADQAITAANNDINDPAKSPVEKAQAKANKEAAEKTRKSAVAILTSMAKNKDLVGEMDDNHEEALRNADLDVMTELVKTVNKLAEDK